MTKNSVFYYSSLFVLLFALLFLSACGIPTCETAMPERMALNSTNDLNIAMDGHDVTAFFSSKTPVKGNSQFQSNHEGVNYHFASEAAKKMFDTNPEKFIPECGGFCAVAASFGKVEPAQVDLFDVFEGKLYFARNAKAQKMWNEDKKTIRDRANNQWPCLVKGNGRKI